jgi:hypothetical protein
MKFLYKNIIPVLMAAIFAISTSGVFFVNHYCNIEKSSYNSFLKPDPFDCCQHEESCCHSEKFHGQSSCKHPQSETQPEGEEVLIAKCCFNTSVYHKISNEYYQNPQIKSNPEFTSDFLFALLPALSQIRHRLIHLRLRAPPLPAKFIFLRNSSLLL